MSKRNRREHGRILSVETMQRGSALDVDAAAGATSITVVDGGDFDEDGGWLYIGAQVIEFTACDDDTGVITFKAGTTLTTAAEQGDPVAVYDPLYGEVVDYQVALVQLDGEYDNPDPVEAEVAEGVEDLPEGDRGKAGESCTLKRVADDEWEVVEVGGRPRRSRGIRFEQDDAYTLTAGDVTAGVAVVPLSHRPIDEALTCVLAGVPQRPTGWTINYDAQTLTIPLDGWEKAGDVAWVHYAYRRGVATATVVGVPEVVGVTMITGPTTSVALPAGTQAGDQLILAETDWSSAACSDGRMTLRDTFPGQFRNLGNTWVGTADGSGTPVAVNFAGTAGRVSGALVAIRAGQLVASPAPATSVAPSAAASGTVPQATAANFVLAVALLRNGALSTGLIDASGGAYTSIGFDNTSAKTCCVVAYWSSPTPATSPADTFTFSGSIDAWAIAAYKIQGV